MTDRSSFPPDLSPLSDPARLAALRATGLLDTPAEEAFDRLTRLAARVLDAPAAFVTLVDDGREFWKSCVGATGPGAGARESPLDRSFCKYVVASAEPLFVDDAREHPLLRDHPAVTEGGVVAYAGMPLVSTEGHALGSLCVVDFQRRGWSERDAAVLRELAAAVMAEVQVRALAAVAENERAERAALLDSALEGLYGMDREGRCTFINRVGAEIVGYTPDELLGRSMHQVIHHTHPDGTPHPEAECRIIRSCLTGECFQTDEDVFWRKDGTPVPVEYACAPLLRAGEQVGGLVTFRDITERKRAEDRMRFQARLLDSVEHAVIATDAQGRVTYWNRAAEELYGWTAEEALGGNIVDLTPAEMSREQAREIMTRLAAGGAWTGEFPVRRRDGTVFPAWISDSPILGPGGALLGIVGVSYDLAERKRAEDTLRESEERYRSMFQGAGEGMFLIGREGDGSFRYVDINPALERMTGFGREQFVGSRAEDLISAEAAARVNALYSRVFTTGEPIEAEHTLLTPRGQVTTRTRFSPLRDPAGQVARVLGITEDVTERMRSEQAIRDSEARLFQILETVPAGVFVVDAAGVSRYANGRAKEILGTWAGPEIRVEELAETYHAYLAGTDERYPVERMPVVRALAGEAATVDDMELHHPDRMVPLHVVGAPIRSTEGTIVGGVAAFMDMSETRMLEAKLRQAIKMEAVGRLAGGLAHDFNNLLTAIRGNTELLLADTLPGDPAREDLEEIRRAADRAASLTRQMLAFSRQELVKPREVDVNQIVAGMQRMLPRLIGEDVELVVQPGEGLDPVLMDPTQLEQVVMNLAVNARDAMPKGGVLVIRTRNVTLTAADQKAHSDAAPGEYVLLEVSDSGHGMDARVLERIFEPFFTTKHSGKGTGLGLAMVYGVVKQAGGYIVPESHPGKGTRFRIYLPRLARSAPPPVDAAAAPGLAPAQSQGTVLLVEDQDDVRRVAARVLTRAGYTVLEASGSEEALRLADQLGGTVDLLLTDVVMPGKNGRELAELVEACCPRARTLFMSGYTEDEMMRRGIRDNAVNFIQKPFSPQELAQKVEEVLKGPGR